MVNSLEPSFSSREFTKTIYKFNQLSLMQRMENASAFEEAADGDTVIIDSPFCPCT